MALTHEDFQDLIDSMGLAGTAAADLDDILGRLARTQAAEAAATKAAAAAGVSIAQIKGALAAANNEAATAAKAAAVAEAAAAKEAAAAAKEAARLAAEQERAAAAANKLAAAQEAAAAKIALAQEKTAQAVEAAAAKMAAAQAAQEAAAAKAAAAQEAAAAKAAAAARTPDQEFAIARTMALQDAQFAAADKAAAAANKGTAATKTATSAQGQLGDSLLQTAESGTRAGGVLGKVQDALAGLGPKGQAAAAVLGLLVIAVTAVTAAITGLIVKAITLSQEEAALHDMLGETLAVTDALAARLPFAGDALEGWAKKLKIVGYEGDQLARALEAVAASAARMRDGGRAAEALLERVKQLEDSGAKISLDRRFLRQLAEAGLGIQDLAKAMGVSADEMKTMKLTADQLGRAIETALIDKGANALKLYGLTWESIRAKFAEGLEEAFVNLGDVVDPFMIELRSLASEFFKGGVASNALTALMREVLPPAFRLATAAVRFLHIAFLQITIAVLKAYIAMKPAIAAVLEWAANSKTLQLVLDNLTPILKLAGAFILAFWAPLGSIVAALVLFAAAVVAVIAALSALADAVISAVGGSLAALDQWIEGGNSAASNFVKAIVNGIKLGAAEVSAAVGDLANQAIAAFTTPLQIKSPSRVMLKHGREDVAGALATGVDEGSEDVDRSMTALTAPPAKGQARGRERGSGKGFSAQFNNCVFGAGLTESMLRDWMERWWEELAGSGPEPEAETT